MPRIPNQPQSSGGNRNISQAAKKVVPKRNKKVKYARKPRTRASVNNRQSSMINRLSKQVFKLQMASYGKTQMNLHSIERALIPTASQPICLDLTDFTCIRQGQTGGSAFQHLAGGGSVPASVSHWERNSIVNNNYYWHNQNKDAPDGGAYLALNCTYHIQVTGLPTLDNTRIRFDVVSQKSMGILPRDDTATDHNLVLPWTLNYMKHLCEPHINRINPTYFKKYFTKVVFINSSKVANQKGTSGNVMRFSFTLKPNKLCVQNETNPTLQNSSFIPDDAPLPTVPTVQPEYEDGNFGPLNVPATQPLWLIISTDDQASTGEDKVEVRMSRRVVWRDSIGSSNL